MRGRGYRGRDLRSAAVHPNIVRIDAVEFSGIDLHIGAHFAKVESVLLVTLILTVAPRKAVIPCAVVKFPGGTNSEITRTDVVSDNVDWATIPRLR
jgi:hypothetical protein